jgi:hypothetical protein
MVSSSEGSDNDELCTTVESAFVWVEELERLFARGSKNLAMLPSADGFAAATTCSAWPSSRGWQVA